MNDLIDQLRTLSRHDHLKVTTAEGKEYTLYVADPPWYEAPTRDGEGDFDMTITLDTDVHDVPEDFPMETGYIDGWSKWQSPEFEEITLTMYVPVLEDGEWVADDYNDLGEVTAVELLGK